VLAFFVPSTPQVAGFAEIEQLPPQGTHRTAKGETLGQSMGKSTLNGLGQGPVPQTGGISRNGLEGTGSGAGAEANVAELPGYKSMNKKESRTTRAIAELIAGEPR